MTDQTQRPNRDGLSRMAISALTIQLNKDRMRAEVTSGIANISNDNKEQAERITAALRLAGFIDENVATMPENMMEAFFNTMKSLDDVLVKQGVADLFKERFNAGINIYPDSFVEKYFMFVRTACNEKTQLRVLTGIEHGLKKYCQRTFGQLTNTVLNAWADEENNTEIKAALDTLLTTQKINKREKHSLNAFGSVSLTRV